MLGAHAHRAELVHLEILSVFSEALLLEYNGAFRSSFTAAATARSIGEVNAVPTIENVISRALFTPLYKNYPSKTAPIKRRIYLFIIIPIYMPIFNTLLC